MLNSFKFLLGIILIAVATMATAKPLESGGSGTRESLGQFIKENEILSQIFQASGKVRAKASALVMQAVSLIGVPYKFGGTSSVTGFDCSGFVFSVYKDVLGLVLPREAKQQARETQKIPRKDLEPGDLVFFNTRHFAYSHVGIYIGDGQFVHSPNKKSDVRIDNLNSSYWSRHFDGARRVDIKGYSLVSSDDAVDTLDTLKYTR